MPMTDNLVTLLKRFACAALLSVGGMSAASAAPFNTGDVFAAVNNGNVFQYRSSGSFIQTLNTGQGGYTTGMAFDTAQNLNVTNFSAGSITRFKPDGTILPPNPYISPAASPQSLSV